MRKISFLQTAIFMLMFALIIALAFGTTRLMLGGLDLGDFRGVILTLAGLVLVYLFAFLVFRAFLYFAPLRDGDIEAGSKQELIYHVYLLFFLILFYPIMRSGAMPVPLMRLVYQALGAKLGANTYSSGIILDPIFVEVGSNSLIGQYSLIVPHMIENEKLGHYPIRIGDGVTIGAHAVVLAGVTIGDGALVATGAVVPKGTQIAAGEIWGGVPAKRLRGPENESTN